MITKEQVEFMRTMWEQSRAAAATAHDAWWSLLQQQQAMIDNLGGNAAPFKAASDQFRKFMEAHEKQYKAAVDYMDKMSAEYEKALAQYQGASGSKKK